MAKVKSKQVPLIIYKGGVPFEIGKAIVAEDGSILGQIKKEFKDDILGPVYEGLGSVLLNPTTS